MFRELDAPESGDCEAGNAFPVSSRRGNRKLKKLNWGNRIAALALHVFVSLL
jgi:hypothetical protein